VPTYRYACVRCHAVHEIFHSITDRSEKKCPDCGGDLERHVGGAGGVLLKGSGFHRTDYRPPPPKEPAKTEKKDGAETKTTKPSEPSGP